MKKFLIVVLAIVAAFFSYSAIDGIALSFSKDYLKYNTNEKEDMQLSDFENSSMEDYYKYLLEHDMIYPQVEDVKIDVVEDIVKIEGFETTPVYNHEGVAKSLQTEEEGSVTWEVDVPKAGYYNVLVDYFPIEGKSSAIERTIKINNELPFEGARNLVLPRIWGSEKEVTQDIHGNDIRPSQIEKPVWTSVFLKDAVGYVTGNFAFYFEEGKNEITFVSEREPLLLSGITLKSIKDLKTYEDVAKEYENKGYEKVGELKTIQAESNKYTTSPTLYPQSDKGSATYPNSPSLIKLNTIGGNNWRVAGDSIAWNFQVEKSGLYQISLRVKQQLATGMTVGRNIYINDEIPFAEMENYSFQHSNSWRIQTLGTKDEPFWFYFEEGKNYEFKMEASLGRYGSRIAKIESSINNLSKIYREILVYTGPQPDPNRDYNLSTRIPDLIPRIEKELNSLKLVRDDIIRISGSKSEKTGILDTIILQLEDFIKKPSDIHKKLKPYNDNISSLGTLIILLSSQPLEIDYFVLHGEEQKLPKNRRSFLPNFFFKTRAFFATFTTDYSSIGKTTDSKDVTTIEVWLTVGKDQSNILRKLIDEQFTPKHNIQVDLKLVSGAALLPATLSGKGPDVAMGVGSNVPVNYALRNATYDLAKFDDFDDVKTRFMDSAMVPFTFDEGVYALPEQQIFLMMFYRTDIFEEYGLETPETWDDVIQLVIDLQKYNLEFYLPVPQTQGAVVNLPPNPIFSTMFYQNDGEFYINGNTESGFDAGKGPEVFERWTEFYTDYSFSVEANFANRFRNGQMPIGITYYNTYNTLSVFAPEIRGKWDFMPVPGTKYIDEDGNEAIRRETVSTNTGAMILNGSKKKDESWEFLKWWTEHETQTRFGREMEGILGAAARYPTANVQSMQSLPWTMKELDLLQEQWDWVRGIPEVPGSYMTGRHLDNALRLVLKDSANPRETIYDYVQTINEEIRKKRSEFNLD